MNQPYQTDFPNRNIFATYLITTMAVLAALAGTGYGPPMWWAGVAAWLGGALMWPRLGTAQKRQAILLAGIGALAYLITVAQGVRPQWLALLTQNTEVLGMLAAVSFLQLISAPNGKSEPLPQGRQALWRTGIGMHLLGAVINMSALFIMAERIGPKGKPTAEQAALLVRTYLTAALWSPFFAATAVAFTYAPGVNALRLALIGMTLSIVLIWLAGRDVLRASPDKGASFIGYPMHLAALRVPCLLALVVGIGHWLAPGWTALSVVSLGALAMVVILMLWKQGPLQAAKDISHHAQTRLPGMAGEVVLFIAAGTFAAGLRELILAGTIGMPFSHFGVMQAAIVLAMMIALAAMGIHTVISITMASALLLPLTPEPTLLALTFIEAWAIGLAAGPMSAVHLSLQGRYGLPAAQLAKTNIRYCLQGYVVAVLWLAIVGWWGGSRML